MDKDRKRRDWFEARTLVEDSDNWTDPDREVFSLDDDELNMDRPMDAADLTDPDVVPPPALPAADTSQADFLEAPTNLWEEDPTPHAPQRVEQPSGAWQARTAAPPAAAPPILQDNSREHLDLLDESDIVDDQPDHRSPSPYPEVYQGGYADSNPGEMAGDYIDDFADEFAGDGYADDYSDLEDDEFSGATSVRDPQLQLEAPSNVNVRTVHEIAPDSRLLVMTQPGTLAAEQYRVLSLKLRESNDRRIISVLVPTSEVEGAVVAANLALALAEGSRSNVLLLDANLRGSEIADLFGLQMGMPLGEQIRHHKRSPEDPWEVLGLGPSFHVVAAKPVQTNPSALLSSEIMADLVDDLRRKFDFVVISAPPVMDAADGVILQDYVDGAILAALAGVTRTDSVRASLGRLGEGKIIGTVLLGS